HRLVLDSPLVALDGLELQPLRIRVHRVHDPARPRRHRPQVQVVRRREAEPHQLTPLEDGHAKTHVRTVRGPVVGRVVNDHIPLFEALPSLLEEPENPLHVARNRTQLQRRRKRTLADLPTLGVQQRYPKVLRLTNDRRVGHPRQLVPHLQHHVVQRSRDHPRRDRIDLPRALPPRRPPGGRAPPHRRGSRPPAPAALPPRPCPPPGGVAHATTRPPRLLRRGTVPTSWGPYLGGSPPRNELAQGTHRLPASLS